MCREEREGCPWQLPGPDRAPAQIYYFLKTPTPTPPVRTNTFQIWNKHISKLDQIYFTTGRYTFKILNKYISKLEKKYLSKLEKNTSQSLNRYISKLETPRYVEAKYLVILPTLSFRGNFSWHPEMACADMPLGKLQIANSICSRWRGSHQDFVENARGGRGFSAEAWRL